MLTALKAAPSSRQPDAAKCYPASSRASGARDADSIHAGLRPAFSSARRRHADAEPKRRIRSREQLRTAGTPRLSLGGFGSLAA